jgi:uncharacterized membrane protein YkvA (DUF1232 family)
VLADIAGNRVLGVDDAAVLVETSAMNVLARLHGWARKTKRDAVALWLAARDPRVLWYAKVIAAAVAA